MKIEIKNRWNDSLIFSGEFISLKLAVEYCISTRISLSNADLRDANLRAANLRAANLSDANLSNADLSDAPFAVPHLDAKILARIQSGGKLQMNCWHSCETSHCRAGWAVVVAGPAGRALEWMQGTHAAASLIYAASRPKDKIPDFAADLDSEEVLSDIKKCAAADPLPN
jgi:hypothetical protein